MLTEVNDKLQAEVLRLKEEITSLKKERAKLKRAEGNLAKVRNELKEFKNTTKGSQHKKYKSAETTAKRLQKENQNYKQLLQEKDQELDEKDQELEEKDQQMEERDEDNMKLKRKVAASSRLDNQITDETFREAMSYAYTTVHDCFFSVLRRRDFSESASQSLESRQTHYSRDVDVKLPEWQEDLHAYLPDYKDSPSENILHLCIATVGYILAAAVNTKNVFGSPFTDHIEAATVFWRYIPGELLRYRRCEVNLGTNLRSRASNRQSAKEDHTMALTHQRDSHRQGSTDYGRCERIHTGRRVGHNQGISGRVDRSEGHCRHARGA